MIWQPLRSNKSVSVSKNLRLRLGQALGCGSLTQEPVTKRRHRFMAQLLWMVGEIVGKFAGCMQADIIQSDQAVLAGIRFPHSEPNAGFGDHPRSAKLFMNTVYTQYKFMNAVYTLYNC